MQVDYSFNHFRYMRMLMSEFQREVEAAFSVLTEKYCLPKPLLFSHNWILQCLYYSEKPLTLSEISRAADVALPNVSVAVKALIEDGLIAQKEQKNKRICAVSMTENGRMICDDYLNNYLSRIDQRIYAGIPREKHMIMKEYYMQIGQNIEQNNHVQK